MRAWWLVGVLAGCDAASPALGYDAFIQLPAAQFRPGPFPAATGGPEAQSVITSHSMVTIGRVDERLHAVLAGSATATIIGVDGQLGAWILPAGLPDIDVPGSASVTTTFAIADDADPGPFTLLVSAVDRDGRIGEPAQTMLVADPVPPPDGDLVVGLVWEGTADLDLHVVDPLGNDAWAGSPNTWKPPPPGEPVDPNAFLTGGILDRDANASCRHDGAPSEHVIWKPRVGAAGPVTPVIVPGTYTVRVDARSLCSEPSAQWYVEVLRSGELIAAARGVSIADDVLAPHGDGAGVLSLTFTVP